MQYDVGGTDSHRNLVPLSVCQAVGKHLSVGLLTLGAVVETHLTALPTALQLQEPEWTSGQGIDLDIQYQSKGLDKPIHSRVFLYFYYFLHCRIIVKLSKL